MKIKKSKTVDLFFFFPNLCFYYDKDMNKGFKF